MPFNVQPRGNLNSVGPLRRVADYRREEEEFNQRKQAAALQAAALQQKMDAAPAAGLLEREKFAFEQKKHAADMAMEQRKLESGAGGKDFAVLAIADRLSKLQAVIRDPNTPEDVKRVATMDMNNVIMANKGLLKGQQLDQQGNVGQMGGFADTVRDTKYAEASGAQQGKQDVNAATAPSIAAAVEKAKLQQQLAFQPELRGNIAAAEKEARGDVSEREDAQKSRRSISKMVDHLRSDFTELHAMGGMVDENASAWENLAVSARASDPGQYLGKVTGAKEQRLRTQIKEAKPKLLLAITQAGGASARGLDSDAELKLWLSVAGDEKAPIQSELEMLDRVEDLLGQGSGEEYVAPAVSGQTINFEDLAE